MNANEVQKLDLVLNGSPFTYFKIKKTYTLFVGEDELKLTNVLYLRMN